MTANPPPTQASLFRLTHLKKGSRLPLVSISADVSELMESAAGSVELAGGAAASGAGAGAGAAAGPAAAGAAAGGAPCGAAKLSAATDFVPTSTMIVTLATRPPRRASIVCSPAGIASAN